MYVTLRAHNEVLSRAALHLETKVCQEIPPKSPALHILYKSKNEIPRVTDLVLYLVPYDPQEWEQPDHVDHPLTAQLDGEHLRLRLRLRQPSL